MVLVVLKDSTVELVNVALHKRLEFPYLVLALAYYKQSFTSRSYKNVTVRCLKQSVGSWSHVAREMVTAEVVVMIIILRQAVGASHPQASFAVTHQSHHLVIDNSGAVILII